MNKYLFRLLPLCLLISLTGCGVHFANQAQTAPSQSPPTQPPPVAGQSGSITINPQYVALLPGGTQNFSATGAAGQPLQWSVNGIPGGNSSVGVVSSTGVYTAPSSLPQSTNVTVTAALASSPQANFATAVVSLIDQGVVTSTANPQVATYSIYLPAPGTVSISFGKSTSYNLNTWAQATPSPNGGQINIYVAGMLASTQYHMTARITLSDGATLTDVDHTFETGIPPVTSPVAATTFSGQQPQPGVEMFDTLVPWEPSQAFATDLQGNIIWTYSYPGSHEDVVQPIKMLPNGHFLVLLSYASSIAVKSGKIIPNTIDEVREVDLAGNTTRSITEANLASSLSAAGYNLALGSLHHDVLELPNGHWILLATVSKSVTLTGSTSPTNVLGDVLIDVDQNSKPVWVWNSFDHLDVNRHPYLFPDWTHSNALLYSADDHNLLLSMRHQNWIIKIDYQDGQGSGNILWRLGKDGDFKLVNGTDPTDWFYAQHGMSFFTSNTTGVWKLGLMDNGDDRYFPASGGGSTQVNCSPPNNAGSAQCYSTTPVLQIDDSAKTATLVYHYVAPTNLYNFFGGNVELEQNGDMAADFCAAAGGSVVQEFRMNSNTNPQLVWQATTKGNNQYRAERLPSLYPGVQW